jgi:hypothetical protein
MDGKRETKPGFPLAPQFGAAALDFDGCVREVERSPVMFSLYPRFIAIGFFP